MRIKRRFGLEPIESFKRGGIPNTKRLRRNEKKQKKYTSKLEDENLSDRKRKRYEKRLNKANDRVAEEQYNAVNWGFEDLKNKGVIRQIPLRGELNDTFQSQGSPSFSIDNSNKLLTDMYTRGVEDESRRTKMYNDRIEAEARARAKAEAEAARLKKEKEARLKAEAESKAKAETSTGPTTEVPLGDGSESIYDTPEGRRFWDMQRGLADQRNRRIHEEVYKKFGDPNVAVADRDPNQPQFKQWTAADQAASDARAHNQMLYEQQHLYKPLDVGAITNPQDVALQYDRQRANTEAALEMGLLFSAAGTPLGSAKVTPYQAPKQLGGRTVGQKMLGVPNTSTFGRAVPMGNGINDAGRVVNVVQSSGAVHAPGTVMKALPAPKYLPVQSSNPVVGLIKGTNVGPNGQYIIGFKQGGKVKKRFF